MNSAKTVDAYIEQWKKEGVSRAGIAVKTAEAMLGWPYVWGAVGAECTVQKRQYYMGRSGIGPGDVELVRKRCQVLNGSSQYCDGCKYFPDMERTRINDCQGFVKQVCKAAGVTLTGGGCTSMWKNDSQWQTKGLIKDMPDVVCCVFKHIASTGKMDHIGLHVGGGRIIHCSVEVKEGKTTDKGWTHWAIPKGLDGDVPVPVWRSTIRKGSTGDDVIYCQDMLIRLGYDVGKYGADGKFGTKTLEAVKAFQKDHGLTADGIVGPLTWDALENAAPEGGLYTVTVLHLPKFKAEALLNTYPGSSMEKEE